SLFSASAPLATLTLSLHDALPIFNAITPAGMVDIEDVDDPDGTDNARQQLHERRLILVGGVVLILTSLIGTIALQLTTLQEFLGDRKSTRLNSSHVSISSAVFSSK